MATADEQTSLKSAAPEAPGPASAPALSVALFFDLDGCHAATGVARHALGQIERLARRPDVAFRLLSGRMRHPDGLAYWESLDGTDRRELPLRTRDLLRWWRIQPWPPIDWWSGAVDWVYCPAEYYVAARRARVAVTSHDAVWCLRSQSERQRSRLAKVFENADLVLSVSRFNTERLIEAFPACQGRVALVPNAADDLFFEDAPSHERQRTRAELGLPASVPYLLSVASFQPRKNLVRLIEAAARLPEVAAGDLALVLIGGGDEDEARPLRAAAAAAGPKAIVRMPGYRQGRALRAAYAEAEALAFPSLCESFGIPALEAMAQGVPVALADSTGLPEIGGDAGWYFGPESTDAIAACLRRMLDDSVERARRAALGRAIANHYRWQNANDRLVAALSAHRDRPRRAPGARP